MELIEKSDGRSRWAAGLLAALCLGVVATACTATKTPEEMDRQALLATVVDDPATPDVDEAAVAAAEAQAIEDHAAARQVNGLLQVVTPFLPGSAAFQPWLLSLGLLGFKRFRKNALGGLKSAGEGLLDMGRTDRTMAEASEKLTGGIRKVIAATGLIHSNDDPIKVLNGARAAALARGDQAQADRILALIQAELAAKAAA